MEAVLLDAGGVILDETEYERVGAEVITSILKAEIPDYSIERYWADTEESALGLVPHTRDYLFWKHAHGDLDLFASLKGRYKDVWGRVRPGLTLMQGIGVEIERLSRGFRIVLCGQYGQEIMELLDRSNLSAYFASRATQDDYRITKPDPRYFERICEREGLESGRCIMVGDRMDKDVIPAKLLGMGSIFVRSGIYKNQKARTPDELPDLTLEGVEGLADAISSRWRGKPPVTSPARASRN